ncbi:hypothetical protein C8J56DRAFT_1044884 [Mycena floridula]|nr:hypothetical protein C8J56DRAFT_1044884 [Mycena floridula]
MAIDLPVELWLHVISFLPSPHLIRRLIRVNRLLFNLAQDEIYAEMHLRIDWQSKFANMSDADLMISHRVRHLHIDAHVVQWQPDPRSNGVLAQLTPWRKTRDSARSRIWQNTVKRLVNLQHLTVDCAKNLSSITPFLISILSTSYQSLSVLSITISWLDLSEFRQCCLSLPHSIIQAFDLTLTGASKTTGQSDNLTKYLGPVLLSQATSLTSFSLSSNARNLGFIDFFSLLADTTLLLSSLALELDFENAVSWHALNELLESKKKTLQSLNLRASGVSSNRSSPFTRWYYMDFSQIELPQLKSLALGFASPEINQALSMVSVRLPLPKLTTLVLWDHFINLHDILQPFSRAKYSFVALESLGLTIKNFEVYTLAELNALFPLLHHLDVRFLHIGHHEQEIWQPFQESEEEFCLHCTDPSLVSRWKLREITVRRVCKECLKLRRSSSAIEKAIVELIPSTRDWVEMMADAPPERQTSCQCLGV